MAKLKLNIVTLGCSKNKVDSEHLAGLLPANMYQIRHDSDKKADVVVVNTCGFIGDAKEESVDTILSYAAARKQGDVKQLIVMGCLSERYKKALENEIHEVDAFFGASDLNAIAKLLTATNDSNSRLVPYHYKRVLSTPRHYAYLKVSEGCDRGCSFCAIPLIRGKHKSIPIPDLVNEARYLASKGTKELILIAQDLTYYGIDLYGERKIGQLVSQLAEIPTIKWIRLQYAYPAGFPEDLIALMATNTKVCRYLDLPLQHISDRVLKSMKRGLTKKQSLELIQKIRRQIPGLAFRTTLIVGYPGETQEEFDELYDFVKTQQFERLGVFTYSAEEDTPAYVLTDDVPEEVKNERLERIMALQQEISQKLNAQRIGTVMEVIVDSEEAGYYVGRSMFDSPEVDNEVLISKEGAQLKVGGFYQVIITDASEFDLQGTAVAVSGN
ncbi:MAG: 30S ribosomal protein S12 methylthiotransferase RimO [Bacteroidales bacterium]|nr:30S ribosomal protein S12 methylthiotransferase RimO [Bacteroidales bacterium]